MGPLEETADKNLFRFETSGCLKQSIGSLDTSDEDSSSAYPGLKRTPT